MRLKNKVAIITGGNRGVGKGISLRFAEEGASLAINYVSNEKTAQETLEEVNKFGIKAIILKADIRDEKRVEEMVKKTIDEFGKIDILVNNAGVLKDRAITRMTLEEWNYVIDTNLTGTFLCTRAVVRYMKEANYGKIVNIASRGIWGNPGQANYAASKGGVVSMTRALALELARFNINVNCIAPGNVYTEMFESMKEDVRQRLIQAQLTGQMGTLREIANAVLFLASDEASYIRGETVLVDGGRTLAAGSLGRILQS